MRMEFYARIATNYRLWIDNLIGLFRPSAKVGEKIDFAKPSLFTFNSHFLAWLPLFGYINSIV
jgi:hypothetical protein